MAKTQKLNNLVINRVESIEVYEYMLANGYIKEDELYFVEGEDYYNKEEVDAAINEKGVYWHEF
jgi:hypothetical protein